MNLLMVSGDRQVAVGERGPFWSMLRHFSTFFVTFILFVPMTSTTSTAAYSHGRSSIVTLKFIRNKVSVFASKMTPVWTCA